MSRSKVKVTRDRMTRNNTLNNVHVAATEISQLLSQNTNTHVHVCSERQPHKVAVRLCSAIKLNEKIKLLEVKGTRAPVPHSWQRQWCLQTTPLSYFWCTGCIKKRSFMTARRDSECVQKLRTATIKQTQMWAYGCSYRIIRKLPDT